MDFFQDFEQEIVLLLEKNPRIERIIRFIENIEQTGTFPQSIMIKNNSKMLAFFQAFFLFVCLFLIVENVEIEWGKKLIVAVLLTNCWWWWLFAIIIRPNAPVWHWSYQFGEKNNEETDEYQQKKSLSVKCFYGGGNEY